MTRGKSQATAGAGTRNRGAAQNMFSEWKRGMLSFWVLGLLLTQSRYGLEIRREIEEGTRGRITLGVSTLYQLLRRLERKGLVKSRWEPSTLGPPRAYYKITPAGREVIRQFADEILNPQSPISAGLGRLTAALFQEFGNTQGEG
jgi:PadR family transcriptional regulator PadR